MLINLIATPRNLSTALMYSFGERADMRIVDEPYYGYFLEKTGFLHPGRTETLAGQFSDPAKVTRQLKIMAKGSRHVFIKNMAKHIEGIDFAILKDFKNIILLRNPKQLIASFATVIPDIDDAEIGLGHQYKIFQYLKNETGEPPVCLDAGELLKNPEKALSGVCAAIGIPFDSEMLSWEAGPRPEDGPWAQYWYANVHTSTGFAMQTSSSRPLPEACKPLYEAVLPLYQEMFTHSIKA